MAHPELDVAPNKRVRNPHGATMHLEGAPLDMLPQMMDGRMLSQVHQALVQVMIAATGAGVHDHSDVKERTVERVVGSMFPITASVFDDENGETIAQFIRDIHKDIKGFDHDGNRYHALDPETWKRTMYTFFDAARQNLVRFDARYEMASPEKKREMLNQLYAEFITWYQRFGVSDRTLAADYDEFEVEWQEMVENELVMTESAEWGFDFIRENKLPRPRAVPPRVWNALELPLKPVAYAMGKMVMSGLPPEVREKYKDQLPAYTKMDERVVETVEDVVKATWPLLPAFVRYPAENLELLQRQGKHNDPVNRTAVMGYKALKRVFLPFYKHADHVVNSEQKDLSTYVGDVDFYPEG